MKLPSKLRICGQVWTVKPVKDLIKKTLKGGRAIAGDCDPNTKILRVDTSGSRDTALSSLVHEALHACVAMSGHRVPDRAEEKTIQALEAPLLSLLRDNRQWWK